MEVCQQFVIINLLGGKGAGVAAVVIVRVSETAQKTAHGWIVVGVVNRVELVLKLVRIAHFRSKLEGRKMSRQAIVSRERKSAREVQLWAVGGADVYVSQSVLVRVESIYSALSNQAWLVNVWINRKLEIA